MKGTKITDDDALTLGLGVMLNADLVINGTNSAVTASREDVLKTETDDFTVDTCAAFDTGVWETGVLDERYNNGAWIIVSQYEDRASAVEGHQKWVDEMSQAPVKLYDIFSDAEFSQG